MVLDNMVLRMEDFNVLGVHILGLLGGLQEKPIQVGWALAKKGGLDSLPI